MGKPMSVSISGPEAILTQEKKNSNIPKMTEPNYFSWMMCFSATSVELNDK